MPGILRRTRAYLEFTLRPPGYFVDFLNFASDFAPDQLSDSGKLASFQNGAPNTLCFPWKFPETQSAGDPLFSFLFAGKLCLAQSGPSRRVFPSLHAGIFTAEKENFRGNHDDRCQTSPNG